MIFYFTGTGNSKYVADRLQKEFKGEMVNIANALFDEQYEYDVQDGEIVFFVFPTYYYSMPHQLKQFIKRIKINENIKICGIATCGGTSAGTDKDFKKAFKNRGFEVKAFYEVKMPENYIAMFNVPLPEEQIMIVRRADKHLDDICDAIKYNFRVSYKSPWGSSIIGKLAGLVYSSGRPTKKFYADEKCISCGLCKDVCTDRIITMGEDGKPKWDAKKCTHCMACISRCPEKAIQYGKKTANRERYLSSSLK